MREVPPAYQTRQGKGQVDALSCGLISGLRRSHRLCGSCGIKNGKKCILCSAFVPFNGRAAVRVTATTSVLQLNVTCCSRSAGGARWALSAAWARSSNVHRRMGIQQCCIATRFSTVDIQLTAARSSTVESAQTGDHCPSICPPSPSVK